MEALRNMHLYQIPQRLDQVGADVPTVYSRVVSRLYEEMEESLRQTRALQRLTSAVAGSLDLQETLEHALNAATRRLVVAREGRKAIQQPIIAILMAAGTYVGVVLWNLHVLTSRYG